MFDRRKVFYDYDLNHMSGKMSDAARFITYLLITAAHSATGHVGNGASWSPMNRVYRNDGELAARS